MLDKVQIQIQCVKQAAALVDQKKITPQETRNFVVAVRQASAPENAMPLIIRVARQQTAECNESENYKIMLQSLSHPKDYPSTANSYFEKVKTLAKSCLKDKEFQKDFMDELKSDNSYVKANACDILLAEKLVKTCKGA